MMAAQTLRSGFTLAAAETEITRRLRAGERVLLVGASRTNLPRALAEHPQVQLWDSDGPRARTVPAPVRVVLFTKWVGHNQHHQIREDAARDKARFIWPELLGTGEIRRLLQPLIADAVSPLVEAQEPLEQTPPPAPPTPTAVCDCGYIGSGLAWGFSTREFVEVHWSHDGDRANGWQAREAERLHRLAGQHGLSTSLHYLQTLVSQLNTQRGQQARDEEQLSRERADLARQAVAQAQHEQAQRHQPEVPITARVEAWLDSTEVATPPAPTITPTPATVAAGESRTAAELTELLRMIDDATAVLSLARETLVQLAADNAEQRAVRDRLRARVKAALEEAI
jgi:hypothetical protein